MISTGAGVRVVGMCGSAQGTEVIEGAPEAVARFNPGRIGLLGGVTALPDYYREHGGRVLNCAGSATHAK